MHVICPIHVRERMEQRNIKTEQIEEAILNPHVNLPTQNKRRKRVMRKFGSKTLNVIYEPRGKDKLVLVTTVWLEDKDRKVKG